VSLTYHTASLSFRLIRTGFLYFLSNVALYLVIPLVATRIDLAKECGNIYVKRKVWCYQVE